MGVLPGGDLRLSMSYRYGFGDTYLRGSDEADPYKIRVMPTQVFLYKDGIEFHRHEGFYPESEIDSLLTTRGLSILPG